MDQQKIGEFLSRVRKERGMTQAELGEKLGVGQRTVSRWETGRNLPDISLLQPLCDTVGITVAELLNGERTEGDSLPAERANSAITGLLALWKEKRKRKNLIWAGVSLLLTLALMLLVYSAEFSVSISSTADLEKAIDGYHFDKAFTSDVVEWTSIGNRMAVLYLQNGHENAGGLALLEKGIFGNYRFLSASDVNDPLFKVRAFRAGGQTHLLLYSVGSLPREVSFSLRSPNDPEGHPLLQGPVYQAPFLLHLEVKGDPSDYTDWDSVRYFAPDGEELDHFDLLRVIHQDPSASQSGYGSAELGAVYVFMGVILLLGFIFIRYFLTKE